MNKNKLRIDFNDPLNILDTEMSTYGCRANNPDICSSCYLPDICAFSSKDGICRKPSRAWKKQYLKLKEDSSNG